MTQTNGIGNADTLSTALGATARTEQRLSNAAHGGGRQAPAVGSGDSSANLSSMGSILANVDATSSDVRTDKVAALKSAIESGNYNVPASAVADKLLSGMLG